MISRGIFTLLFRIHGWVRACAAVMRLRISLFSNRFTKSFASGETEGQGASSKLRSALNAARKIPDSVRTQKGRLPQSKMYVITLMLNTSASIEYDLCSTSGAT
ncbi:hypothetical protein KC19_7G154400, partial [Ceratodon purpureus]